MRIQTKGSKLCLGRVGEHRVCLERGDACKVGAHKAKKVALASADAFYVPSKDHKGQQCAFVEPWIGVESLTQSFSPTFVRGEPRRGSAGVEALILEAKEAWEIAQLQAQEVAQIKA